MARKSIWLNLPTQTIVLLVVMIILTSSAIGIPAILLIREQFNRQGWEQVKQDSQMVNALLGAQNSELSNLAILTAQRPTLLQLLALDDPDRLSSYLETLRAGATLDLMMLCSSAGEPLVQVGLSISAQACQVGPSPQVFQPLDGAPGSGWILAAQPVLEHSDAFVVVGRALDQRFSQDLRDQTGLDHLLLYNGDLIGGSFPDNSLVWEAVTAQQPVLANVSENSPVSDRFSLDRTNYYAVRSRYADTDLETIVLLPGTLIAEAQQELTWSVTSGILIVTLICSILAVLLTRRISQPLEHLRDSAIALRKGDLNTPVVTDAKVREVAEVTYALEDARIALRHTLEELRQQKAWVDHLLESVVEGIITLDRYGRITFFSQGAERITGCEQDQIIGKSIDEVLRLTDRDVYFSQRIPAAGAKQEIATILVNERPVTIAIEGARLSPPEAGKASLALFIRDVSNEEAMRGLLGDFLANITHEFRTPLTALAVSIELLLDQLPELSQDELHELLVSNHLGVLSLQNLIDNLLEGASIEAGHFQVFPRPVELAGVICEVVQVMQPLMEKKQLELKMDVPPDLPLVRADYRRTSQVLVNLLSNAVKWGPPGSQIYLGAAVTDGVVKVSVADQGSGIPAEHKRNLFVRFDRVDAQDGRAEYGAGLGLSVVKAIVESQQGQVGVEDMSGGGTLFWFTIPVVDVYATGEEDNG